MTRVSATEFKNNIGAFSDDRARDHHKPSA